MSAFLVSKKHIDALVFARQLHPHYRASGPALSDDDLGRMLWRENMASLNARYRDAIDEATLAEYRFEIVGADIYRGRRLEIVDFIKAVHCYQYQACEHDGWERSEAARYCEGLLSMLTHRLPGYDDSPWGLDDDAPAEAPKPKAPEPPPEGDAFTVRIELGNDAMRTRTDIRKALDGVTKAMRTEAERRKQPLRMWGSASGKILDVNGNTVGEWAVGKEAASK